ncbi:hypothetical protein H0H92_002139 [Tricholoma furcatifolium]|nr:hypothetical protein H0H92_002139 [Tricholoma furcatifolium]
MTVPDSPATAEHFIYVTQVYFCDMVDPLDSRKSRISLFYWVIAVVPYLLYCFVVDHPLATCEKIFRIPVALAMWNQVGSQCMARVILLSYRSYLHTHKNLAFPAVLLIRTYAFFNRNVYVLLLLISALSGVIAYQLYVDISQMLLLPFMKPPYASRAYSCYEDKLTMLGRLWALACQGPNLTLHTFLIAPLLFDTLVTAMTVWKAFNIRRHNGGPNSRLIQTFLREGVFYYILISIANLINGIFYLQPRQAISAMNIPLSVMMGPILACRLILDLRERGSETVSHSEGTGIAAFTTKSMSQQQCSPFTPPHRKSMVGYGRRNRGGNTISSNIMLSTLGSIHHDVDLEDFERDVSEIEDIRRGIGMDLGTLSTAVGGDDGEPIPEDDEVGTPAPAYEPLEMGLRGIKICPAIEDARLNGIKVEVERMTSTI